MNTVSSHDIFALSIAGRVLIYAPLHGLVALIDQPAADALRLELAGESRMQKSGKLASLIETLRLPGQPVPQPRQAEMGLPMFLGLVTTRGCNMGCGYCDFAAPKQTSPVMNLNTARQAIDAYLNLLESRDAGHAELHFFGGEPFFAMRAVHFAVEYALAKATERQMTIHFEAITNGFFNQRNAEWVAKTFDTVFLSFDGPRAIQDRYRTTLNGRSVYDTVARNARLFVENNVELILRACITAETVDQMPEIARSFADTLNPSAVCFETLVLSGLSQINQILQPDPWAFGRNFGLAANVLDAHGIETVLSTAVLNQPRISFCPTGKDAMIVTPDGRVHACYLLEEDWLREGMDLTYGRLDVQSGDLMVDTAALARIHQYNVLNYPLCSDCFCRYDCAGGCHVNRRKALMGSDYDGTCIQTRLIEISMLLKRLNQPELNLRWLEDQDLQRVVVLQKGDRLC